jgi:hypothetical protein
LLEWWQRREWRRRTQWVVPDLLDRAMRETAIVASRATAVVEGAFGERGQDSRLIADAFALPWTPVSDQTLAYVDERRQRALLALMPDEAPTESSQPDHRVVPHSDAKRAGIEEHADKLWALSLELASYLDDRRAPALLTAAANLHDAVRGFVDPFPEETVPAALWPVLASMSLGGVLESSAALARALSDAYGEAEERASDPQLEERFKTEREQRADADKGQGEMIESFTEADQLLRDVEANREALRNGQARLERLARRLDEIEASPDDEETERRLNRVLDEFLEDEDPDDDARGGAAAPPS